MIAAVTDLDGRLTGAHRTWLDPDGFDPVTTRGSNDFTFRNARVGRYVMRLMCSTTWNFAANTGSASTIPAACRNARSATSWVGATSRNSARGRRFISSAVIMIAAPVVVQATFGMAGAIVAEASLSFLGLGVQPPTPSWGSMVNDGRTFLLVAPHLTIWPGLAILVTVLGLNFLGDGLRDWLDVRGR